MTEVDSAASRQYRLVGLEPDNLLAFLALLGLLKALETARPEWRTRVAWRDIPLTAEMHIEGPAHRDEIVLAADQGIRSLASAFVFDRMDITFKPSEFRTLVEASRADRWRASLMAALAAEAALRRDGESLEPTPLCAMFGQGHQHFLSRLAASAKRDDPANLQQLSDALFEPWQYEDDTDGFRWDPVEDRRYALQFGDPSEGKNKIGTVTGANRLAAIGFALMASVPVRKGLATLGIAGERRERDMCWPLVGVPASLGAHLAILSHPDIREEAKAADLNSYGVAGIARARRYQVGKFFNFERARIQML